jgi:hypothetical protein
MTISPRLPSIAGMRSITFAAVTAAAATGAILVAGCGPASRQATLPAATTPVPTTTGTGTATGTGTQQAVAATPAARLPISVESASQMQAEGNDGPSSSILVPASCRLTGTTVTAEGRYANGGLVPNVYDRYGDIIVLYVFAAPSPGEPDGIQLGASDVSESPVLGSRARWHVSLPISPSVGVPARCVVAAQPTHDIQLAPGPVPSDSSPATTASPGGQLPISVESARQMKAAGNNGPSSSILRPASCQLTGTTITAQGTYANGGFVPNLYNRYGDIIVLYVWTAASADYPDGMQLGASEATESPAVGTQAPWRVSLSISSSAGAPARCVVAAQPTHDLQLAP